MFCIFLFPRFAYSFPFSKPEKHLKQKTPSCDDEVSFDCFCLELEKAGEEAEDDVPNHHEEAPDRGKDRPDEGQPADGEEDRKDDDDEDQREDQT